MERNTGEETRKGIERTKSGEEIVGRAFHSFGRFDFSGLSVSCCSGMADGVWTGVGGTVTSKCGVQIDVVG